MIHYSAPPVTGGVEAILGAHARLLSARGYDVRVIAGQGDADLVPEVSSRHPDVERVAHGLAAGEAVEAEFARLEARLAERLHPLLEDRDLIVAHNVLTMPFNLPLACALVAAGLPILAWTHDLAWVNPRYEAYHRQGFPYDLLHEARPRTTYVAISVVRRHEIAATLGLPTASVPLVPNGVDALEFWGVGPATRDLARRGGFAGPGPMVLVPLRITRRKRLELALEAAALLRADHPGLRVVVSGPLGPHSSDNRAYAAELRALRARLDLNETVCFLYELAGPDGAHPVSDQNIAELYRMADCVLMPSESEGFGLPAVEAALGRAPLVAADIEVIREVAGRGGFLFPELGGSGDVARALGRALATRMGRLRRRVLARHDWPSVVGRMETLIEKTCG